MKMDSKDDFKQVLKKFEEAKKLELKIRALEDFLSHEDIKYEAIKISYNTQIGSKSVVLTDEKWGVLDSLHRDLKDYKRDFVKAMWEKNNE